MNKKTASIIILAVFLMLRVPEFALADAHTKSASGKLNCGNSNITANTTYIVDKNIFSVPVLAQHLIWQNTITKIQKELKLDGDYVIKHIPEKRRVLDAAVGGWACLKSKQGKYYFVLSYYCTSGEEKGVCAPGNVEWARILREDGTPIDKGSRQSLISRSDDEVYRSLGLYDATRKIQLRGIDE